tara:strand:- start:380 stop:889 length:510 start_codon:yes stop_codon:yes gene_type:complete
MNISGIVKGEPKGMFRIGYPGPKHQKIKKLGEWTTSKGNYHTWLEDSEGNIYDPTPMNSDPFDNRMDYHVSKIDKSKKFYKEFPSSISSYHEKHIKDRILNEVIVPNSKIGRNFSDILDENYNKYQKGACYFNCLVFKNKNPHLKIVFGAMGYWCMDEYKGYVCLRWGC